LNSAKTRGNALPGLGIVLLGVLVYFLCGIRDAKPLRAGSDQDG
jgi:hypothetical protein